MRARRLGPREVPLARRAVRAIHGRAAPPRALAAFLADPAHHLYAAFLDERVIGLAYGYELPFVKRGTSCFLLYEIDTHPRFRRRGAARAIVEAMKAACRARGVREAWVLTNASNRPATALYRASGARRPNSDDAMFRWRLTPRPSS